jgi:hypothetical protein
MTQNNETRLEELEAALVILTGDDGSFYPARALSNPEAVGYNAVVDALRAIYNTDCPEYLDRYEWDAMDNDERAEYAEDYCEFCEVCDSFNSSIISKAKRTAEWELKQIA